MSSVETRKFEPATGTAVNLGASGDAVTLPAGVTLKTNTIKDAGGNTIFTSDGAGTLSSVNSALQGGMVFISSQTASSSASLSFTSGIDSTYDEYVFYFVNINPASDQASFTWQASTDGGSSYGMTITSSAFQAYQNEAGDSYALQYNTASDKAQATTFQNITYLQGNESDKSSSGELHLFNPSSTTYVKNFYSIANNCEHQDMTQNMFIGGYINSTSDVDAIQFKMSSGNFDGTIAMYGIK